MHAETGLKPSTLSNLPNKSPTRQPLNHRASTCIYLDDYIYCILLVIAQLLNFKRLYTERVIMLFRLLRIALLQRTKCHIQFQQQSAKSV